MFRYKCDILLKEILGEQKFKELNDYTLKRVKEVFGKQTLYKTKKLVYANTSTVLIIGVVKAKEYDNDELLERLHINDLQSKMFFVEKDIDKFIAEFYEYINIIETNMKGGFKLGK